MYLCVVVVTCTGIIVSKISSKPNEDTPEEKEEWPIPVWRTDKIPLGTKGRTSILSYREYVRPAELHSQSAEENCPTENVSSLRSVKVATPPCAAYAAIPCGLAVRKRFWQTVCRQQVWRLDINKSSAWSKPYGGLTVLRTPVYPSGGFFCVIDHFPHFSAAKAFSHSRT